MIMLQRQTDVGTDTGVVLWHFTGNAGNTWQLYSVDIGIVNYPFVVSAFFFSATSTCLWIFERGGGGGGGGGGNTED